MNGLLLDTHVAIWWFEESARLSHDVRVTIEEGTFDVFVSAATAWEIVIKSAKGHLKTPDDFEETAVDAGFRFLSMTVPHALAIRDLERNHNDPFDRMLVAQARVEGLTLVTNDPWIQRYDVSVMAA